MTSRLPFRFHPPWWAVALAAAGCAAGIALGNWQSDRAAQKQAAASVQKVVLKGEFVPRYTVLLDNKVHRGRPGYHVVQPLRILDTGKHVLVNRGWVALKERRELLPVFQTPSGVVVLEGVRRARFARAYGTPNLFGARIFLEQAAAQGYAHAIYALGKEYDVGGPAFPHDVARATEMFRAAAMLGHVDAQVDLATQYLLGRGGVPQDDHVAAQWYERAAEAGHWGAQFLIASMYEHGNGVNRDEALALQWYERAGQGGDEVAPLKAEQLRLRLATKTRQLRLD